MPLAVAPAGFALPTAALASPSAQQATRLASYCSPSGDVSRGPAIAADEHGAGAAEVMSGAVTFARREKFVQFDRSVRIQRGGQSIEAESAVGHLSDDQQRSVTYPIHT